MLAGHMAQSLTWWVKLFGGSGGVLGGLRNVVGLEGYLKDYLLVKIVLDGELEKAPFSEEFLYAQSDVVPVKVRVARGCQMRIKSTMKASL